MFGYWVFTVIVESSFDAVPPYFIQHVYARICYHIGFFLYGRYSRSLAVSLFSKVEVKAVFLVQENIFCTWRSLDVVIVLR